jgi:UDP-glucose 4-epimerase
VRVSVEMQPAFDASINVVGFVNLLEGAGAGGVERVVFASSGGTVYGDPLEIPTPETAPNCPISPYGASKLAGEHIRPHARCPSRVRGRLHALFQRVRPRQDPKSEAGVVSIFVSRLLERRPLTIFGDGTQNAGLRVRPGRGTGQPAGGHRPAPAGWCA